jgi:hypothetical protein
VTEPLHPDADGHAGDLVSAHVDGELDPETEEWVTRHLETCGTCREAADAARAAKALLGNLPPVDGAGVVEGFLARHRATIRTGSAFVGAAAVVLGALALTSAAVHPEVVPDVDALAAAHVATAEAMGGTARVPLGPPAVDGMADMRETDRVAGHYAAPPAVLATGVRLSRQAMFRGRDLTVVVYRDGRSAVSVFEQPGSLQWGELPPGEVAAIGSREVWVRDGRPTVMVAEVGDLVVTLVSDDRAALTAVVDGLPERERTSVWTRLHDACLRFTRTFGGG